ncbi:MAG: MBL fold metallo-hydrolase [bacterium]|nr:MAG: MBL fold metallo-hydrolase [bacterium]
MKSSFISVMTVCVILCSASTPIFGQFETDTFTTSQGELLITFIGHGSLIFDFAGMTIHIDPFSRLADYTTLPKADIVALTHEHLDHLDPKALREIVTDETTIILTESCTAKGQTGITMHNGDTVMVRGLRIVAVPAYNIVHKRTNGEPFHPKGKGNGYVMTFGDCTVYIAGDTEVIPEMKDLSDIDIAFLPMNLPYTMTPEMVSEAARSFRPAILYPYHYGDTDPNRLVELLAKETDIEVRIRRMR